MQSRVPHNDDEGRNEALIDRLEHNLRVLHGHVNRKRSTILDVLAKIESIDSSSSTATREILEEVREKLRLVLRSEPMLTEVERKFLERDRSRADILRSAYPALSGDEIHVCLGILDGLTTEEIASEMCRALKTVDTMRQNIRNVLGIMGSGLLLSDVLTDAIRNG